jgi:hypothetical protein
MRRTTNTALDVAVAALQPFYEAGEDGYPVSLALDALAGILGTNAGVTVEAENGLTSLLEALNAPGDLRADVKKLYENAAGGEYGMGLSKKQAKVVNDLVEGLVEPLVEFITGYRRRKVRRLGSRKQTKKGLR